ncbi:methionine-tRNA ligase [Pneumocystis jirovecii RU7]|uniref:methionine--tRNA ligase n=1 Tax=Pneumocystis jirovecii (strain RU7) TaxID=1408657 RepID=A0A0W4ZWC4_PNEJ7|nr:methionine-tRNA ligase [Pneumocystis jirovecii RU7]KTW32680.1 methionine-tRNA ligase [Pneumocystis jirovecii RU7]
MLRRNRHLATAVMATSVETADPRCRLRVAQQGAGPRRRGVQGRETWTLSGPRAPQSALSRPPPAHIAPLGRPGPASRGAVRDGRGDGPATGRWCRRLLGGAQGDDVFARCGMPPVGVWGRTEPSYMQQVQQGTLSEYTVYLRDGRVWDGDGDKGAGAESDAEGAMRQVPQSPLRCLQVGCFLLTEAQDCVRYFYGSTQERIFGGKDDTAVGSCPKCLYEGQDARGDQCDSCGQLLDPFELKEPKCKLDGEAPVERETKHIFMLLNKLQPQVEAWVKVSSEAGKWSANGISITSNFLKMGLEPRCITRDLKWGTPVPTEVPNMEGKVLYVWFDATIGYISITANYTENWSEWWNNPENVQLYQFMGKDNVPFHTIIFPATLIATNKKWTMLHHLSTTEYLKYEGGKFSKSRGVGVFGDNVQKTNIPSSVWRYYLLVSRPEVSDTMFSWAEFIQRNNSELLANLGNFVNRVVKFVNMKYGSLVPSYIQHPYTFDNGSGDDAFHGSSSDHLCFLELHRDINRILVQYIEHMDAVKIRYSLKLVFDFSSRGNLFLQTNRLNNALFDGNPQHCADVIGYMVNLIYLISACIAPFMPSTSRSIADQLNVPQRSIPDTWTLDILPGHRINKAFVCLCLFIADSFSYHLFSRIDEKMADFWRDSFGSS